MTESYFQLNWAMTVDQVFNILGRTRGVDVVIKRNAVMANSVSPLPESGYSATSLSRGKMGRNNERPDVSVLFQGVLMLIVEEKVDKLEQVVVDIRDKIVWNEVTHGDKLPYLLAVAAAGTRA
jgi:hypothetical protein